MELEIYSEIKQTVKSMLSLNLDHYKDEQMRRRLDSWLVRSGEPDWGAYFSRIKTDLKERSRFRDYLTINVSAFFRDPERWASLRDSVIPLLLKAKNPGDPNQASLDIWSAGCSIGAEPYTLAMMMDEVLPRRKHSILATDFDQGALNRAREGGPYLAEEILNLSATQRNLYLKPGGPPYYVQSDLTQRIDFKEHNLLDDPHPANLDLIVCRNVVIYFTTEAKNVLYQKFSQALKPGGVLFVGATEILPRPHEFSLRGFGISFYQKV